VPLDQYRFDEESFDALDRAGIAWSEIHSALYGEHPQIRRNVGSDGLQIVARTIQGRWLVIGLTEASEDVWLLADIRGVSSDEAAALDAMFRGGEIR
jgi:hypothetical protein